MCKCFTLTVYFIYQCICQNAASTKSNTLSNVYNIYVNSNVLSKIYASLLKNQFLPKVVQAIYNTFTVYHIHCTYLYLKYPSVKKSDDHAS